MQLERGLGCNTPCTSPEITMLSRPCGASCSRPSADLRMALARSGHLAGGRDCLQEQPGQARGVQAVAAGRIQ